MFTHEDGLRICRAIFGLVDFSWPGEIEVRQGKGLHVRVEGDKAVVEAEDQSALARAFFRMAQEKRAGKDTFEVREERRFESCGAFLDFSRNGVMTVEACKRYMDHIAALGMNLLVIYT